MSMGELGCIAQACLACVILSPIFFPGLDRPTFFHPRPALVKWRLPKPFIAQGQAVTMSFEARQVASGQVKPYVIGHNG
jgi:hypothetical protein